MLVLVVVLLVIICCVVFPVKEPAVPLAPEAPVGPVTPVGHVAPVAPTPVGPVGPVAPDVPAELNDTPLPAQNTPSVIATRPPTYTLPATPAPPLTTNAPVVVLVLVVAFPEGKVIEPDVVKLYIL